MPTRFKAEPQNTGTRSPAMTARRKAARNSSLMAAVLCVPISIALGFISVAAKFLYPDIKSLYALPVFLQHMNPLLAGIVTTSLVASTVAGIGEEVIFRLFFIPFWTWLVSTVILRGRWENEIFWVVAACSALTFAVSHVPGVMATFGIERIGDVPTPLMGEIIVLNGIVSLLTAYAFRKYGFLAAVGVHFWTDVVWHVIWGALS